MQNHRFCLWSEDISFTSNTVQRGAAKQEEAVNLSQFSPSEGHIAATIKSSEEDLYIFVTGGYFHENPALNQIVNKIRIFRFNLWNDTIYQYDTTTLSGPNKANKQKSTKNKWFGSELPPLSDAGIITMFEPGFGPVVYIYGGFDLSQNKTSEEIWIFRNLLKGDLDCTLIPGQETVKLSCWSQAELREKNAHYQMGDIPVERQGHKLAKAGKNTFYMIGGHCKIYGTNWHNTHSFMFAQMEGVYLFNVETNIWTECQLHGDLVKRSLFGIESKENTIYLCGGNRYEGTDGIQKLSIGEVVPLNWNENAGSPAERMINITHKVITLPDIYGWTPNLAGISMKFYNNNLFVFGGSNNFTRENILKASQKLVFIDLQAGTAVLQDPEPSLAMKTAVYGSSIHIFGGGHTAMILGGSLAKAGTTAGRSNFVLTSKKVRAPPCEATKCRIESGEVFGGNALMMECNACKKFIHIFICGKHKGKKAPRKNSYKCPDCMKTNK